ncbi:MAG: alpha/beta hydrolase, partial [Chloroflexota bacterium]
GAALALEAAIKLGSKVRKLALYEPPYNDDEAARQSWRDFRAQLDETLAQGRRGDAVGLFMLLLGMSAEHLEEMHQYPMWSMWEAIAPTMAYDAAAMGEDASIPTERAAQVTVPTLIMDGGATEFPFMHIAAEALAEVMPNGQQRTLEGQTHEVAVEALAPVLIEFFSA